MLKKLAMLSYKLMKNMANFCLSWEMIYESRVQEGCHFEGI